MQVHAIIGSDNLTDRKPWRRYLEIAGIGQPFTFSRDSINILFHSAGICSGDTWNDQGRVYDFYIMGCNTDILCAVFCYSDSSLVAFWTEERLKGYKREKFLGKYVYYSDPGEGAHLKKQLCRVYKHELYFGPQSKSYRFETTGGK